MNELEVFDRLSKEQPRHELVQRLSDKQVEDGIVALGEWRVVLAIEAVNRGLHKKDNKYTSLHEYFQVGLHMRQGTARDLADRVVLALELEPDSSEGSPGEGPVELAKSLKRREVRELSRNPDALEEAKERVANGEEPQKAVEKVVGEIVPRGVGEETTNNKQRMRRREDTTPLNFTVRKQEQSVENFLSSIEGALIGLMSIQEFHPETPSKKLEEWAERIQGESRKAGIISQLHIVKKRMRQSQSNSKD